MDTIKHASYTAAHIAIQGTTTVVKNLHPVKLGPFLVAAGTSLLPTATAQVERDYKLCLVNPPGNIQNYPISGVLYDQQENGMRVGCGKFNPEEYEREVPVPVYTPGDERLVALYTSGILLTAGIVLYYGNKAANKLIAYLRPETAQAKEILAKKED